MVMGLGGGRMEGGEDRLVEVLLGVGVMMMGSGAQPDRGLPVHGLHGSSFLLLPHSLTHHTQLDHGLILTKQVGRSQLPQIRLARLDIRILV